MNAWPAVPWARGAAPAVVMVALAGSVALILGGCTVAGYSFGSGLGNMHTRAISINEIRRVQQGQRVCMILRSGARIEGAFSAEALPDSIVVTSSPTARDPWAFRPRAARRLSAAPDEVARIEISRREYGAAGAALGAMADILVLRHFLAGREQPTPGPPRLQSGR